MPPGASGIWPSGLVPGGWGRAGSHLGVHISRFSMANPLCRRTSAASDLELALLSGIPFAVQLWRLDFTRLEPRLPMGAFYNLFLQYICLFMHLTLRKSYDKYRRLVMLDGLSMTAHFVFLRVVHKRDSKQPNNSCSLIMILEHLLSWNLERTKTPTQPHLMIHTHTSMDTSAPLWTEQLITQCLAGLLGAAGLGPKRLLPRSFGLTALAAILICLDLKLVLSSNTAESTPTVVGVHETIRTFFHLWAFEILGRNAKVIVSGDHTTSTSFAVNTSVRLVIVCQAVSATLVLFDWVGWFCTIDVVCLQVHTESSDARAPANA